MASAITIMGIANSSASNPEVTDSLLPPEAESESGAVVGASNDPLAPPPPKWPPPPLGKDWDGALDPACGMTSVTSSKSRLSLALVLSQSQSKSMKKTYAPKSASG